MLQKRCMTTTTSFRFYFAFSFFSFLFFVSHITHRKSQPQFVQCGKGKGIRIHVRIPHNEATFCNCPYEGCRLHKCLPRQPEGGGFICVQRRESQKPETHFLGTCSICATTEMHHSPPPTTSFVLNHSYVKMSFFSIALLISKKKFKKMSTAHRLRRGGSHCGYKRSCIFSIQPRYARWETAYCLGSSHRNRQTS